MDAQKPPSSEATPGKLKGAVLVEISAGELIDKIAILEIKRQEISDPAKLANVEREHALLCGVRDEMIAPNEALDALTEELAEVNRALWDIEDAIRECEAKGDFGPSFIELARSVYLTNDKRSELKRAINEELGSRIVEEKSYGG